MNFSLQSPSAGASPPPPSATRDLPELQRPGSAPEAVRPVRGRASLALVGRWSAVAASCRRRPRGRASRSGRQPVRRRPTSRSSPTRSSPPTCRSSSASAAASKAPRTRTSTARSRARPRSSSIVPEGTKVDKGQLVCELDSSALKDALDEPGHHHQGGRGRLPERPAHPRGRRDRRQGVRGRRLQAEPRDQPERDRPGRVRAASAPRTASTGPTGCSRRATSRPAQNMPTGSPRRRPSSRWSRPRRS